MPVRDSRTQLCVPVPRGQPGELLYGLDATDISSTFQGYFNNRSASEKKIIRNVAKHGDAWFRTGDILRWDREGRWWFLDRIGDTFRWKGENVSTAEVAQILGQHPAVLEANVYGVEVPSHDGRAGCAALVLTPQHPSSSSPSTSSTTAQTLSSIAAHALASLPPYSTPLFIRLLSRPTTTDNMKPQKHILRAQGIDPDLQIQDSRTESKHQENQTQKPHDEKEKEKEGKGIPQAAAAADEAQLWWLRGGTYVPFRREDWLALQTGRARL